MPDAHEGSVTLQHTFSGTWHWLETMGRVELRTSVGTRFEVQAAKVSKGPRLGQRVIRFFYSKEHESARAYDCCWGHYHNCYGTRIGMYCAALDDAMA